MAFRAWNRGLAATVEDPRASYSSAVNPFGVWLFNGHTWFSDPTFPGSGECPGSTVFWAGKLDYWLIGSGGDEPVFGAPTQTLCRFDGVNLVWEPLPLPAATLARLPVAPDGTPLGGVTAGACYAWNDCWFFGTDGIVVRWDGQQLSDASVGVAPSPWLRGDFTAAGAWTDPSGARFGLATVAARSSAGNIWTSVGPQPDGSPPPELYRSAGGPFAPAPLERDSQPGSPSPTYPTDPRAVASDSVGDAWLAVGPALGDAPKSQPAPLLRVTRDGVTTPCSGYDAHTFSAGPGGYVWRSLSVFPDSGAALAGAQYQGTADLWSGQQDVEPAIVHAACGQPPTVTLFRMPNPFTSGPALVPANASSNGLTHAVVAANAANDAWAAAPYGRLISPDGSSTVTLTPNLYRLTDGQPPAAPAGDENESRPSVFTLDAPVYVRPPPTVVQSPPTVTTTTQHAPTRRAKAKPALDPRSIHTKLVKRGTTFTLYVIFRVLIPVTIGVEALRHGNVVARSGVRRLDVGRRRLAMTLDIKRWPTSLKFVTAGH